MNQALLMRYEAALESLKDADITPADVFYDVLEELTRQEEPTPEMLEAGYNVTVGDWSDAKGLLRAQYLAMRALIMRKALEDAMLARIQKFERRSGMQVHSVKIFPGEAINGRRLCAGVEVAAQLR